MITAEFLVVILLLSSIFATLYLEYANYRDHALKVEQEVIQGLDRAFVISIIESLKVYGSPFEYDGELPKIQDLPPGIEFDPLTGKYIYRTHER